jgi:serine protease Do
VTKELAESFKLDSTDGVVVVNVEASSPAQKAGLQVGDVILAYDGKRIEEPNMLPRLVAGTKPGAQAKLDVVRKGERRTLTATVGEIPAQASARAGGQDKKASTPSRLGFAVREITPQERKQLGVEYGVLVVDVDQGPAARSAIQPGDVIVAVNQTRFSSVEEFTKLIGEQQKGARVALLVRRGEASLYVPMEVG